MCTDPSVIINRDHTRRYWHVLSVMRASSHSVYEMVVLLRSSPSVSQLAPGSPQDLHFYSCDLIQRDESENWLWHMHDKYSAPLRSLFLFARTQNKYNEFINAEVDKLSLERLINILR